MACDTAAVIGDNHGLGSVLNAQRLGWQIHPTLKCLLSDGQGCTIGTLTNARAVVLIMFWWVGGEGRGTCLHSEGQLHVHICADWVVLALGKLQ